MGFWEQLGTGIVGTLILVIIGLGQCALVWLLKKKTELQTEAASLVAWQAQKAAEQAATKVADKVEEVKMTLKSTEAARARQLDQIEVTARATHTLVNSQRGATLRVAAVALRELASRTRDPKDIKAAEAAEAEFAEHEARQQSVDRQQDQNRAEGRPTV